MAVVEVAARTPPQGVETLLENVAYLQPMLEVSEQGRLRLRLTIQGAGVAETCLKAISTARTVTGAEAVSCEVRLLAQQEQPAPKAEGRQASRPAGELFIPRQATGDSPRSRPRYQGREEAG